jgi:hypothetical protein
LREIPEVWVAMEMASVPGRKIEPVERCQLISDQAARSARQTAELVALDCLLAGANRRPKVGEHSAVLLEVRGELRIRRASDVPREFSVAIRGTVLPKERTTPSVG